MSIVVITAFLIFAACFIQFVIIRYDLIGGLFNGEPFAYINLLIWIAIIVFIVWSIQHKRNVKARIISEAAEERRRVREEFYNGYSEISVKDFLSVRRTNSSDVTGVYVIHNLSKDMYYVGQGKNISQRVFSHFNGSGNGDVYADYKYGDEFTVKIIPLANSGYNSIDRLEADTISMYNAYYKGYNKTRGNHI